ncbi:GTP 3',8-cyclase MoaA [Desulfuromonas carbonis]
MQDLFGRSINYLRLSITDRCNLRCRYCMPADGVPPLGHDAILSYEELLRVARLAVQLGVRKIRVTGGEPLVRRGVVDFVAALCALPERPEVVLTTNGLLLADYAADLARVGLARVNVSLDTLRPERFREITRREGLERVLAGLAAAEQAGLAPLKLNIVPIRGVNEDEIIDFARLTLRHPWEVRFIEFMPFGQGLDYPADRRLPAPRILEELSRLGLLLPVSRVGNAGPARLYRYADSVGQIGVIPAISGHICSECNRLRLTADGRIRPCLLGDQEIDLRQLLRAGAGDEELCQALLGAVCAKPERHRLGDGGQVRNRRPMTGIGG